MVSVPCPRRQLNLHLQASFLVPLHFQALNGLAGRDVHPFAHLARHAAENDISSNQGERNQQRT